MHERKETTGLQTLDCKSRFRHCFLIFLFAILTMYRKQQTCHTIQKYFDKYPESPAVLIPKILSSWRLFYCHWHRLKWYQERSLDASFARLPIRLRLSEKLLIEGKGAKWMQRRRKIPWSDRTETFVCLFVVNWKIPKPWKFCWKMSDRCPTSGIFNFRQRGTLQIDISSITGRAFTEEALPPKGKEEGSERCANMH